MFLTLVPLNRGLSYFEKDVDPDQLASIKAIWSGFTLFYNLNEIYAYNWTAVANDPQGLMRR